MEAILNPSYHCIVGTDLMQFRGSIRTLLLQIRKGSHRARCHRELPHQFWVAFDNSGKATDVAEFDSTTSVGSGKRDHGIPKIGTTEHTEKLFDVRKRMGTVEVS